MTQATTDVLFDTDRVLGRIHLNRPKALNSLTESMCRQVREKLAQWADDPAIEAVLLTGDGDKAFCAGGDVVRVSKSAKDGGDDWWRFFHEEYRMNEAIARFPKPFISWIDGISMGGGFGISAHGSHRVATPRTLFAMPETGLGLIPDVGGGYFLPRCPGRLGLYLALTGYRCDPADSLYCGYATHHLPSEALDTVAEALAQGDKPADEILGAAAVDPGPAPLADHRGDIDRCFAGNDVAAILETLDKEDSEWAARQAKTLRRMSPMSLAVTAEQLRRGAGLSTLEEVLVMEFRIVCALVHDGHDFHEGVRALLIDKDKAPIWQPDTLDSISQADIETHFAPAIVGDLRFA